MTAKTSARQSQFHYRTCHLRETMCGIEVEYDGENIIAIRGDKNDVLSKGNICPKATGVQDIHTDPDRLRKPLIRERLDPTKKSHRDGRREVDWNEAINFAAEGVASVQRQYGRGAAGSYCGRSTAHNIGALLGVNLLRKGLETRHTYTGSTCDQVPYNFHGITCWGINSSPQSPI